MDEIPPDLQPLHRQPALVDSSPLCLLAPARAGPRLPRKSRPGSEATAATPTSAEILGSSNGFNGGADAAAATVDSGTIQSGGSVRSIHDVISKFGDNKRRLVQSIGFGGLLSFPPIKSTNRKFSAWLMGKVDIRNSSLSLPDASSLKFSSEDVALVFGIPADGKSVSEARQLDREARERMKLRCWPQSHKDNQSIKAVEDVVDATYNDPMTPDEEETFKVAFVVFVMSTLFVPGAKHGYAHVDYWGALADPNGIHQYNWAAYIHKRLLMAASKYKSDIETGSRTPIITGCYLFLQVFYLDNMDIPPWSVDHTVLPRISCFAHERLRSMIAADTHDRQDTRAPCVYGRSMVRPREQSCYTWARVALGTPVDARAQTRTSLWHAVLNVITSHRVPLEAAGPLCVAAAEMARPSETDNRRSTIGCIADLLQIVQPFRRGFNGSIDPTPPRLEEPQGARDTPDVLHHNYDGAESSSTGCNCRCRKRPCGVSERVTDPADLASMSMGSFAAPVCADNGAAKRHRTTSQVSPGEPVQGRGQTTEQYRLDLNIANLETDGCHSTPRDVTSHVAALPKNPWDVGEDWLCSSIDMDVQHVLPATAHATPPTMPRIVDYHPKYIEVMPAAAHAQSVGITDMEMDMFDAIIRCFKRRDDELYKGEGRLRWRHYFESDILAAILAGWFDINNPCMRNQFVGAHLPYDISNCSMLFFPVILHERWVCFSWDLKANSIIVFDPACMNIPGFSSRSMYTHVADMLKSTLSSAIPNVIPNWHHDWSAASILPFHWRYAGMPCSNRTGVLCAYFCRCYNGQQLQPHIAQEQIEQVAARLFAELREVHGGRLPRGARVL